MVIEQWREVTENQRHLESPIPWACYNDVGKENMKLVLIYYNIEQMGKHFNHIGTQNSQLEKGDKNNGFKYMCNHVLVCM